MNNCLAPRLVPDLYLFLQGRLDGSGLDVSKGVRIYV